MAIDAARHAIAAIRISGRPDVLFVDVAAGDARRGDPVTVETADGRLDGRVVIAPNEVAGDFGVLENTLSGSLERRGAELVADLTVDTTEPAPRHIGAAVRRASLSGRQSSMDDLYRAFESNSPRLGGRVDTGQGLGVVVALDRERGVAVVDLDDGRTVEVDSQAQKERSDQQSVL